MKSGTWLMFLATVCHTSGALALPSTGSKNPKPQLDHRTLISARSVSDVTRSLFSEVKPAPTQSLVRETDMPPLLQNPTATNKSSSPANSTAPTSSPQSSGNEYVVLLDPDHPSPPGLPAVLARVGLHAQHPDVTHVFNNSAFQGFAGNLKNHCVTSLNQMTDVKHVEAPLRVESTSAQTRKNTPWGLQRVSQRAPVSGDDAKMSFHYAYENTGNLGGGVDIYVIDTGLNTDHLAFAGRARMGFSKDGPSALNAKSDTVGHGTHTAGTAGADVFGVASGANLVGVQVLGSDGTGSTTDTIKGIDFVMQQHDQRKNEAGFIGSIASMSLGSSQRSLGMEHAIGTAVDAGVHFSVAAGNQKQNACDGTPASMGGSGADGKGGKAVTVGSINIKDQISSFSNTGPCVDVYAPGENVISTWIGGKDEVNTLSGTSMATPHVTGLMAYLMNQNQTLANCPPCMKEFIASSSFSKSLTPNKNMVSPDRGLLVNNGLAALNGQSIAGGEGHNTTTSHTIARSTRRRRSSLPNLLTGN